MLSKKISLLIVPLIATFSLHANDPLNDPFFKDPFGDDIFKEMMQMQKNMDKMFDKMHNRIQKRSSGLINPLGTYQVAQQSEFEDKGKHYELVTSIPEHKENQIEISAKDGILSITAKIIQKQESKSANSFSTSSTMRMYQQSMPLPQDADEGSVKAEYKKGKLVISLGKKSGIQKTVPNIKINAEKGEKEKNDTKEGNATIKKMTINSDLPSMS